MNNAYLDTSILFAALHQAHALHIPARELLRETTRQYQLCTTNHTIAELYNHFTKQGTNRVSLPPDQAAVLFTSLRTQVTMVDLTVVDYEAALARCVELNLAGPLIYDALHYQAALKTKAEVIYTDNLRDFNRLARPGDPVRVVGIR